MSEICNLITSNDYCTRNNGYDYNDVTEDRSQQTNHLFADGLTCLSTLSCSFFLIFSRFISFAQSGFAFKAFHSVRIIFQRKKLCCRCCCCCCCCVQSTPSSHKDQCYFNKNSNKKGFAINDVTHFGTILNPYRQSI